MSGISVPPPDAGRWGREAADIATAARRLAGFQPRETRQMMAAGLCGVCRGRLDRRSSNASCAHRHVGHRGDDDGGRDD